MILPTNIETMCELHTENISGIFCWAIFSQTREVLFVELKLQQVHTKFMHRLHNLLAPPWRWAQSFWTCFYSFFLRWQLFILLLLSELLLLPLLLPLSFREMRNMCNNTLLPVSDCCLSGMQKNAILWKENDTKGGIGLPKKMSFEFAVECLDRLVMSFHLKHIISRN